MTVTRMARTGLAIVVVSQTHIFIDLSNVCRLPLHMRASHKLRVAGLIEVRHSIRLGDNQKDFARQLRVFASVCFF